MNKLFALLLILVSCSTSSVVGTLNDEKISNLIGTKITIEGKAINAKLGALLTAKDGSSIWIDGLESWPAGFYLGEENGKILSVTGIVIEKYDLPVFIYKEGGPQKSGIPVPEGTDLKEASRRYLLKGAKWKVVL